MAEALDVRPKWLIDEVGYATEYEQSIADERREEAEYRERLATNRLDPKSDVVWMREDRGFDRDQHARLSEVWLAWESPAVSALYWEVVMRMVRHRAWFSSRAEIVEFAHSLGDWAQALFRLLPRPAEVDDQAREDVLIAALAAAARLSAAAEPDAIGILNQALELGGEARLEDRSLDELEELHQRLIAELKARPTKTPSRPPDEEDTDG